MWAAGGDHLDVVKWLLGETHASSANPHGTHESPSAVLNPPMDPNVGNKEGRTALMWACKTAAERTVAYLLSLRTVDPTLTMKSGSGAFDWAVFGGAIPVMELVAASPRVDITAKNLAGCSAIMWASSAGCVPTLYAGLLSILSLVRVVRAAGH
jgi:ankyrin repeat protein